MELQTWLIYTLAAIGLSLSPGPNGLLALTHGALCGTFAAIEITTELFIASLAHRISPWLQRVGRRFNHACGGVFVAIGAALPLRS